MRLGLQAGFDHRRAGCRERSGAVQDQFDSLQSFAQLRGIVEAERADLKLQFLRQRCKLVGVADGEHRLLSARSEDHTSELQSLMRISYAVFCLQKKNNNIN